MNEETTCKRAAFGSPVYPGRCGNRENALFRTIGILLTVVVAIGWGTAVGAETMATGFSCQGLQGLNGAPGDPAEVGGISTLDPVGVALATIKGLHETMQEELQEKDREFADQQNQI